MWSFGWIYQPEIINMIILHLSEVQLNYSRILNWVINILPSLFGHIIYHSIFQILILILTLIFILTSGVLCPIFHNDYDATKSRNSLLQWLYIHKT